MKTRKSNKLIDKLRVAYETASDDAKPQIADLGERLTKIHQECITFLISFNHQDEPKTTEVPF